MPAVNPSTENDTRCPTLLDDLPEMVWTALPDGRLEYVNRTMVERTGLAGAELLDWGWSRLLPSEESDARLEAWRAAMQGGTAFTVEQRLRLACGEFRWHLTRAVPVKNADGTVRNWSGTHTDIHLLKEREAALKAEQRQKDDFLAFFVHELRNPLGPLTNAVQILESTKQNPAQVGSMLPIIHRQVGALRRLIDDSLDVSRILQGRVTSQRERISAASIVKEALAAALPAAAERNVPLAVTGSDADAWLNADRARLTQALVILLSSAVLATEPPGKVELSVEPVGHDTIFRVRDGGAGVEPAQLIGMFDLVSPTHAPGRSSGGLGIGLWLVRCLVELHGGTVQAVSDGATGRGCEFIVRLPCADVPDSSPREATPSLAPAETKSNKLPLFKILVVDDVLASARMLALMLSTIDQSVDTAFDGPSAIACVSDGAFDVVFLDVSMPGMDGREVARRLRADPRFSRLYIVGLSGYDEEDAKQASHQAGFDEHLVKPASLDQLTAALMRAALRRLEASKQPKTPS